MLARDRLSRAAGSCVNPLAMDEAAVVTGLGRGDTAAFDAAYDAYRARLFGFLLRLTRERALAEELVQETFVRLAQHARRLRADTRLGAWLFTVARNLALSAARRRAWQELRVGVLRLVPEQRRIVPPDELLEGSEAQAALEAALAGLPGWAREILLLCGVEAFAPQEAAEILGITPAAARQRLARARAALSAALADEGSAARASGGRR